MTRPRDSVLDDGQEAAALRAELRRWLSRNAPHHLRGVRVPRRPEGRLARDLRAWADRLAGAGLVCVGWPRAYGGRGWSVIEIAVMEEEFARADVPRVTRGMGESLVGPSIIVHGTDEQRAYFLPRIIAGTDRYCQGFSEPGAGSDLASLTTSGIVDGDDLVISGQKVWTSWYWDATMLFCLCRTDPGSPRHEGLSYALVPIRRPDGTPNGVEFRPIRQLTGQSHFAETFLTQARAPMFNVIGGLGAGWRVAMTTLGRERGGRVSTRYAVMAELFWHLADEMRSRGKLADPVVRQLLAAAYTRTEILRFHDLRVMSALRSGSDPGAGGSASLHKVMWSEYQQWLTAQAINLLGADSLIVGDDYALNSWQQAYLTSRSDTIWGGTAEIQRNILAERVLGLPRETRGPA
jgi:alkylation response protein AidB-like acyl-CoA dehydrogenase